MGEGKTVTSVNLAGVLALNRDEQVLLIDADLRRSSMRSYFNVDHAPGLAEVLAGTCPLEKVLLQVAAQPNFYLLPPGEPAKNPAELFDSRNWPAAAAQLREQFGRVVIDCPPVESVADYDLITAECDRIILVVRPDHTRRQALANALKRTSEKLLGVVMNDAEDWFLWRRTAVYEYRHPGKPRS
jgi:capsular exopolysaccharide synthesis family protein